MKLEDKKSFFSKSLKFLVIALITLGIIFRFANLDLRPYWFDETYTSLQISGYNDPEVRQKVNESIVTAEALKKYQYPSSEKSIKDTVQNIAEKEPQLTPLYFILTRFWVQAFGDSVAATRSFSAVLSILTLFAIYQFCLELFKSKSTAWIAVALVAVSPFHVLYAQEARPPAFWAFTIVLSHISLLRAIRLQTPVSWFLYTLSGAISLYTYLFSILVLAGHGIYILITERFRISKTLISFAISFVVSLGSFIPWLLIFLSNISAANQGNSPAILKAPVNYLTRWIRNIGLLFADFNVGEQSSKVVLIPFLLLLLVIAGVVIYALYYIYRRTPKSISAFVLTAIAIPFLPLFLKDLVSGGGVSTNGRYIIPSLIGIHVSVAYLFNSQLNLVDSPKRLRSIFWRGTMVFLLLLGTLSCSYMVRSELWWNKAEANLDRQLANQVINQAKNPLLVSDSYFAFALSISHSLDPKVKFLLAPENSTPTPPENFKGDIFLYRPSQILLDTLKQSYILKLVSVQDAYTPGGKSQEQRLWRLHRP